MFGYVDRLVMPVPEFQTPNTPNSGHSPYEISPINAINPNYINLDSIRPMNLSNIFDQIDVSVDNEDVISFSMDSLNLQTVPNCDEDCPICLTSMENGDIICGGCHSSHRFHRSCIQQWNRSTCPMCRGNL